MIFKKSTRVVVGFSRIWYIKRSFEVMYISVSMRKILTLDSWKKNFLAQLFTYWILYSFFSFFLISGNWILVPNCGNHYEISPALAPEYSAKKNIHTIAHLIRSRPVINCYPVNLYRAKLDVPKILKLSFTFKCLVTIPITW